MPTGIQYTCGPCHQCEEGNCDHCTAERLAKEGWLKDPKIHCRCLRNGHKTTERVKSAKMRFLCYAFV